MSMLTAAIAAQRRGFHIFPVARNSKIPHRLAGQWGLTATNDLVQIINFWTSVDPHANIGVACKPSELLVIDLDTAKEPGQLQKTEWAHLHDAYGEYVNGEELFDEMWFKLGNGAAGGYQGAYTIRTRSGGLHLYYRWPAHWPRISQASPVKGIVDVRGNGGQYGGYVLGEGSEVDGGVYQKDHPAVRNISLPPEWIRLLVAERPQQPKIQKPKGLMQPGAISNSGLVASVQNAGEGNRNNALVWAARTMCEEGASEQQALETLGPAAESAGLGALEVERTIQSAYRTQRYKMGN